MALLTLRSPTDQVSIVGGHDPGVNLTLGGWNQGQDSSSDTGIRSRSEFKLAHVGGFGDMESCVILNITLVVNAHPQEIHVQHANRALRVVLVVGELDSYSHTGSLRFLHKGERHLESNMLSKRDQNPDASALRANV